MRIDIYEKVSLFKVEKIKPNYSEISRRFNCDPRTVKRYYEGGIKERKRQIRPSKLDSYREIIESKLDLGVSAMAIYKFIGKAGYEGKYTILRDYVSRIRAEKTKRATVRVETNPGLSAQVDWKENFSLHTREGKKVTFNIFLMVYGYSRYKFLEPTLSRDQKALFSAMAHAFDETGGVPREIWFDNMKTVVDQPKTQYSKVVFNQNFYYFSKDIGFHPIACRPYRPQTKGKVEALARLTERLRVHDYEIDGQEDIFALVKTFQDEINKEISQATECPPCDLLHMEKEHLNPLPHADILESYQQELLARKVSHEAMVTYGKVKYSVSPKYINKLVHLEIIDDVLHIHYNGSVIQKHPISDKKFNYDKEDLKEILRSDLFKSKSDEEIETYIERNLKVYDNL
ncbi:MAG: IS21 family transposase [Verrucomicrobiae bacterium]|nr:IS21 family transposase [Verrucomicrobiae bacterium]